MTLPNIQAIVSVALGAVLVVVGLVQQRKKKKLLAEGIETTGEIIEVGGNNGAAGYPVIQFTTKEQAVISEKYKVKVPATRKGSKVLLLYNAENPREFIVKKIL